MGRMGGELLSAEVIKIGVRIGALAGTNWESCLLD